MIQVDGNQSFIILLHLKENAFALSLKFNCVNYAHVTISLSSIYSHKPLMRLILIKPEITSGGVG